VDVVDEHDVAGGARRQSGYEDMRRDAFLKEIAPKPKPVARPFPRAEPRGLGDKVESALSAVGITKDRVERWLGRPCGCWERRERLNKLGRWAAQVLGGKTEQAQEQLDEIVEE
jgi:hypothetical protein